MDICLATNNPGKLQEIQTLLQGKVIIKSLSDVGCFDELPENQDTLEGNSKEKATYVWNKYNIPTIADDTGLEVAALNGSPGVYSARYAGPECDPEKNMKLLLSQLEKTEDRSAQFRTVITFIHENNIKQFDGIVRGRIVYNRLGNKGFGYDPIFQPEGYEQTFAQLSLEEKNRISHRGQAIRKLISFLVNLHG